MSKLKVDIHTQNAVKVAKHEYFIVAEVSLNENVGLLVGTAVKKVREPDCSPSKYWNGYYWTVLIECPNGEQRRICCDSLTPKKTNKFWKAQQRMFNYKFA
jgi:hypothetical protein